MADFNKISESTSTGFAQTLTSPKKAADDRYHTWFSSSFPVLSNLLNKVHSDITDLSEGSTDFQSSEKTLKELIALFPPVRREQPPVKFEPASSDANDLCIPVFAEGEKFGTIEETKTVVQSKPWQTLKFLDGQTDNQSKEETFKPEDLPSPVLRNPNLCYIEHHVHHDSNSTGLLQFCQGSKSKVYRFFDKNVREMDQVIFNPSTNICSDNAEKFCELKLPGPFSCNHSVKRLSFHCNRKTFDMFGVFLLIVDSIYALNCVTAVPYNGVFIPLEFTHDLVKVIAVIRSAFPKQFQDLQKVLMYSTISTTLRKAPLKWNRCMVHVFEDLIIHPLSVFDEEAVEFKVLRMIMRKRAKVLCSLFSDENSSHIFNSSKHRSTLAINFNGVHMEKIAHFLKSSAANCQRNHRVKNIRYEMDDKSFRSILSDIFLSYC